LELIRQARPLTEKPIVAIGGITLEHAATVIAAGADCVAVIRDVVGAEKPGEQARRYLEILGAANHAAAV
jgi:thiamine-phosphate pyrophosphorylase